MPQNYSAHIQTGTVNGAIDSDFPVSLNLQGRIRPQSLDFNVGSGGPLIISATLQTLLGLIDFGLDARAAVAAPRIHDQWEPARLGVEAGIDEGARAELARRGHDVRVMPFAGAVEAATHRDGRFDAAGDPRKSGGAVTR